MMRTKIQIFIGVLVVSVMCINASDNEQARLIAIMNDLKDRMLVHILSNIDSESDKMYAEAGEHESVAAACSLGESEKAPTCIRDTEEIKGLLRAGVTPEVRSRSGDTVLLWAIRYRHDAVAALALKHNADVNARSRAGRTALLLACCHSSSQMVNLLVKAGANLEAADERGMTPLLLAATMKNAEHVTALVLHGAHVKGIPSAKWQEQHYCYLEQIAPYMRQAQLLARERTSYIRIHLEKNWKLPKTLSRLIADLSNTEWYTCATLDVPRASLFGSAYHSD